VARRVNGGWQNGAAGDWQLLTLECSSQLDTVEPCTEDTDALLLQVCAGYVQERQASVLSYQSSFINIINPHPQYSSIIIIIISNPSPVHHHHIKSM